MNAEALDQRCKTRGNVYGMDEPCKSLRYKFEQGDGLIDIAPPCLTGQVDATSILPSTAEKALKQGLIAINPGIIAVC